ncbi:hypothetical protein GCM10020001_019850 [Nonomuraea salmonea]
MKAAMLGSDAVERSGPPQAPDKGKGKPPWRSEGLPGTPGGRPKINWWRFIVTLLVVYAGFFVVSSFVDSGSVETISYTEFTNQVNAKNVKDIYAQGLSVEGDLRSPAKNPDGGSSYTRFATEIPAFANTDQLDQQLATGQVVITSKPITRGFFSNLLLSLLPVLLLAGLWIWIMRRGASMMGGGLGGLGKSKAAKPVDAGQVRVTFEDVAGIDEVENELVEIVDYLKDPGKYRRLGAKLPKGVLLAGPPGTGKTLLARAVAGEAKVPYFSASASEFIEMIVGVGASRVRDLFEEARKVAPSIVFIDEIDAIGRARGGAGGIGGHDEREQTLNQILTEMDGFSGAEGVIVIGATNRPEILDPALLRPGRFDRTVQVGLPDAAGRAAILAVHTRGVPLEGEISLDQIAKTTPGMTGADLANLVNEAALLAAKRGREKVTMADFADALEKLQLGAARSIVMPEEERTRTAFHEAGHALLGMLQPGADPVRKISIIPRGRALGVTLSTPPTPTATPTTSNICAGASPARSGGHGGRAGGVRRHHHRRRERPGAGHHDRPRHGGPVGHVGEGRSADHPAQRRPAAAGLARHARHGGRGGAADRGRMLRARGPGAQRQPRQARRHRGGAAGARDAGRGRGVRRGRAAAVHRGPAARRDAAPAGRGAPLGSRGGRVLSQELGHSGRCFESCSGTSPETRVDRGDRRDT